MMSYVGSVYHGPFALSGCGHLVSCRVWAQRRTILFLNLKYD